jgi:hypothetical protein
VATDILFRERNFVVAGLKNKWARRRKIDFLSSLTSPGAYPRPTPWSAPSLLMRFVQAA